jgi:hypothetical protein
LADEFTLNASLAYSDSEGSEEIMSIVDVLRSISTKLFVKHKQNIGITEEALDLGGLASLGWAFFKNLDETNYVELRSATGAGNDIIRIDPLCCAFFRFGSDVSAPFAIANTATVQLEYVIYAP